MAADAVNGTVIDHRQGPCSSPDVGRVFEGEPRPATPQPVPLGTIADEPVCELSIVELTSGPDVGKRTLLSSSGLPGESTLATGDAITLATNTDGDTTTYTLLDMERSQAIWLWIAVAVILIVAIGALRGLLGLVGLVLTGLVVFGFLIPALLRGTDPTAVAMAAGAAILFPVLFLVHGVNWKSASALAGTLAAMALAAVLGNVAVDTSQLRGLGNEDNLLIHLYLPEVSVPGLLMAGFIIGALGVLNDVTIAQSSTVHELFLASPESSARSTFAAALRVGRDHIASMVYTLVLAYLGTALPLAMLLSVSDRPLMQALSSDVVATELIRSAIGAISLVLAVPITTFIAAHTVRAHKPQLAAKI
ncbi:YibE/F family protein [Corynebacterium sanguinis]|uniref:YibE/F family protein n=1 Tax=Corynebacterium sanguinis TaxID=2594913 RepID=UPI0011861A34|nr:YibE/F family protein [Corynebacterium sanguinis]MDN8576635.1 YibE/F family protein [Corynebacterium sanguinis]QDR77476.1 YibE/F family protein [Corynebacterium sanguinis]TVS25577.1 YibE/F family protein [Corynebacterium sanguinis]